jgi:hypothetical protein
MFAYNPTVNDESGAIRAQGMLGAAQTNAQMVGQLGQDIGGALQSIGGTIAGGMQANAQADSAFEAISAIGQMYPGMKKITTALSGMDPRTRRLASMSILDNLGAISQLGIAGMNAGVRQNAPYYAAGLNNARDLAAGKGTYTPTGGGMAPVEPDLPVADENLPAVGGAPMTAPSSSIPGGQSSIDAINRDRQRRGLPPIK